MPAVRECRLALLPAIPLALAVVGRPWLEADMARHMLLEFPLLLLAGALSGRAVLQRHSPWLSRANQYGLAGLVLVSMVVAYWMIPAALDNAIRSGWIGAVKYLTLFAAGFMLPGSMRLAPLPVQAFWIGNSVWMMATVGMVYQGAARQLCLYYRSDAQVVAGRGLVLTAIALMLGWTFFAWERLRSTTIQDRSTGFRDSTGVASVDVR